jgi:hypothetical protein
MMRWVRLGAQRQRGDKQGDGSDGNFVWGTREFHLVSFSSVVGVASPLCCTRSEPKSSGAISTADAAFARNIERTTERHWTFADTATAPMDEIGHCYVPTEK